MTFSWHEEMVKYDYEVSALLSIKCEKKVGVGKSYCDFPLIRFCKGAFGVYEW